MVKTTGSFTVGKYKTRWRDARVSDQEPALGFCLTHHDPPPARASITSDKSVIVFGFLEWQDAAGVWHGDWPYQVNAALSIAGPTPKSTSRPVGTGKGEVWFNFGKVTPGSYTYTLDFAGDAQFEDGVTMAALQVGELGILDILLASLPLVTVFAIIGAQELNKMGVLGR
jgi:hypothetical protein